MLLDAYRDDELAVRDEQTRQAQKRWDAMTPEQRQVDRAECLERVTNWMSSGSCTMPAPGEPVPACMQAARP